VSWARERIDLLAILGACGVYLVALLAPVDVPPLVHLVAGASLVLFLPGHALLRGLGIGASDAVSRGLFAVAMSIVVTIVLGLVLEAIPWLGLVTDDWRQMLAFVTATLAALGLLGEPDAEASVPAPARPAAIAWALLPLALVAAAWVVSERSVGLAPQPAFTELWALEGDEDRILLGVRNREGEAHPYRLELQPPVVGLESAWEVQLGDGEAWELTTSVPAAMRGSGAEVRLYRPDDEEPYRSVRLPSGHAGGGRGTAD
jgi:hypothetical protein